MSLGRIGVRGGYEAGPALDGRHDGCLVFSSAFGAVLQKSALRVVSASRTLSGGDANRSE